MSTQLFRYVWLVCGPPLWMRAVAAAIVGFGIYLVRLGGPQQADQVLAIALFLQLFGASTGYRARLRAGHFDPVLVARPGAWRLAAIHWIVSVGLGLVVWVALGVATLAARPAVTPTALTPAGLALILYASTVAWTISLAVGRLSGAIVWLGLLIALAAGQQLSALRVAFLPHPVTIVDWARTLRSTLAVPAFLILDPHDLDVRLVLCMFAAAAGAWVGGAWLLGTFDAALERS